ncbi:hypothetical protein E2R68_11145 [Psychromonas sp. RZ22]|uniref:nucleoside-specific channel-forming Tsx family protein n=1 Tax=Psychromonas algarum TaxID=2555643 RepID=UPI001067F12F|nr:outer membrane protein OmpK [Psychromonas sp. RZ22]TEW53704.1 hypothetical protein E2R68_11145 [Psychromonas sp. RZ22]
MKKSLLSCALLASSSVMAADYTDGDIHKNDFKFVQFNYMYAVNELPGESDHDYLEMEFGGRSGIFDLYGYVDVFNPSASKDSDKYDSPKMFMKFAPRVSLDALFQSDFSIGPVKELYFATLFNWDGSSNSTPYNVNNSFWGVGSDIDVAWLGKVGFNIYGLYDLNKRDWNGYQVSTNWFKPFYFFSNGSFFSYQGYIDYQVGMKSEYSTASNGGAMFNGLYWHSDQFALGYGLKLYKDVYGIEDTDAFKSTGISHYFSATYKF